MVEDSLCALAPMKTKRIVQHESMNLDKHLQDSILQNTSNVLVVRIFLAIINLDNLVP